MTELSTAVIVDAVRTPSGKGKPGGALAGVHPIDLLAGTLDALVTRTGLDPAGRGRAARGGAHGGRAVRHRGRF